MKLTVKNLILMCGLLAVLPMTSCSDNEPDNTVTVNLVNTKLTYNGDGEWADALNTEVHGIDCQGVTFSHTATASEWGSYWSGFCASRVTDVDDYTAENTWLDHQYASMSGGGVTGLGTPYLVGYWNSAEGENPASAVVGNFDDRRFYIHRQVCVSEQYDLRILHDAQRLVVFKEICRRRLDEGVVLWRYSQWYCRGSGGFLSCRLPRRKARIGKGLDNGRPVAAQCRQRVEEHLLADGFERFRTVGHEHSRLRGA